MPSHGRTPRGIPTGQLLPPETRRPGASWNSPADAQKSPANSAQGGAYHLLTRFPEHDEVERITANSAVHDGSDLGAWRTAWGDPTTSGVTLTVTEKGYHLRGDGGLDRDYPAVAADLAAMARDRLGAGPTTAPGRLAQGVLARAELSPQAAVAVVSCDNLHANGEVARRVVFDVLEAVAPDTIDWAASTVRFVSTIMVDRITPATTAKDVDQVRYITGVDDPATVVIEPFSEWVLGGEFPAGRPRWERGGALFSDNVSDRERRKLLMLNGAHSLTRSSGCCARTLSSPRWCVTMQQCGSCETGGARPVRSFRFPQPNWTATQRRCSSVSPTLASSTGPHRSPPTAVRSCECIVPVVLAALEASTEVPPAAVTALAAWVACWRRADIHLDDPLASELNRAARGHVRDATARLLALLDPSLAEDEVLVLRVIALARLSVDPPFPRPWLGPEDGPILDGSHDHCCPVDGLGTRLYPCVPRYRYGVNGHRGRSARSIGEAPWSRLSRFVRSGLTSVEVL